MANNRLTLHTDAWAEELGRLPAALGRDAEPILGTHAAAAVAQIRGQYPAGKTGGIRAGVRAVELPGRDPAAPAYRVLTTAPYAKYYEFGTRHARAHHVFFPTNNRQRRVMIDHVSAMVRTHGLNVSGDKG